MSDALARTGIEILFAKLDRIEGKVDALGATLADQVSTLVDFRTVQRGHSAMLTDILRLLRDEKE